MSQQMKALVWHGKSDLRLESVPVPSIGAREVLVKVRYSGICATDQEIFNGEYPYKPPYTLGHEITGTIAKTGSEADHLPIGTRVVVDPAIPCEVCRFCRQGKWEFCRNYRELGITEDGGWAEYAKAPARCVYAIPDSMSDMAAAVFEPLVCPLNASEAAGIHTGDHVLVLGDGPAAMYFVQIARMMGAAAIAVSYRQQARTDALRLYGANELVESDNIDRLRTTSCYMDHDGFDLVIDAVGSSETVLQAVNMARVGGRIILYGLKEAESRAFPHREMVLKNLTLYGRTNGPSLWLKALELVGSGALTIDTIADHVISAGEAARLLSLSSWPWVKAVIDWEKA
ncbi:zinc-dependent alcohol dehydrogenase [Paenibacillus senegalensis]|uniref:zinc-dependent alcohol dehydrogenase n=1 Tax=Paenibacillus senegalensis TaxID=1465766 RepID=UPI00028A16E6|nr:alcohol dehydrogenase catalytic domain-containing protein [Paenibacillus senegalensis]